MSRTLADKSRLLTAHRISALLALALLIIFWSSTVSVEVFGSHDAVARVKTAIAWSTPLMAMLMATAALSGEKLAQGRTSRVLSAKRLRTRLAALNAVLILIPAAIVLSAWAQNARFGSAFVSVQAVELCAGAVNFALLGLNIKAGLRLSHRKRPA